jgi:hypothetical protein
VTTDAQRAGESLLAGVFFFGGLGVVVYWLAKHRSNPGLVGNQSYYRFQPGMTIEEIAERWKDWEKLYDARTKLPKLGMRYGGDYYHGMFHWSEVWPYRDLDRKLDPNVLESVKQRGWAKAIKLIVGQNGVIKIADGNHRIRVAKELDAYVPVEFLFYQEPSPIARRKWSAVEQEGGGWTQEWEERDNPDEFGYWSPRRTR